MSVECEEYGPDELLNELIELTTFPLEQPGDIRLSVLAQRKGVNRATAKAHMVPLLEKGSWVEEKVICSDGKHRIVYRKAK